MKKKCILWLAILTVGIAFVSGSSIRESVRQNQILKEEGRSPEPAATPVPTPRTYDQLIQDSPTRFAFLENTNQVPTSLDVLRENAGEQAEVAGKPAVSVSSVSLFDGRTDGDVMTLDGNILYILSDKNLVILRLNGSESQVISHTKVGTDWTGRESGGFLFGAEEIPTALCCADDRLAVLYDCYCYESGSGDLEYTEYTALDIFDVSDPAAPRTLVRYGQDGVFRAMSLGEGVLLLATEYPVFPREDKGENIVPNIYYNGKPSPLEAADICFAEDGCFAGYSVVGAYEMAEPGQADVKALLGVGADVLSGDGQLYFHSDRRAEVVSRAFEGFTENARISCTDIFRFSMGENGLTVTAGVVNGSLPDSGCMDVRGGTLCMLTVCDEQLYPVEGGNMPFALKESHSGVNITLLDDTLSLLGKVSLDLNREDIRWIGFLEDRVIISLTDGDRSLPVIFADPAVPIVGEDLPEYVTALAVHPWGQDGFTAFSQEEPGKMTLTIYDTRFNILAQRSFGSDFSSTLENTRGYLSHGEENLIGFSADDSYCLYGFNAGEGIVFRADAFLRDWAWNARGFCQGDYLYVADKRELCVAPVGNLSAFLSIPY